MLTFKSYYLLLLFHFLDLQLLKNYAIRFHTSKKSARCSEAGLGPKVTTNICSWYNKEYKNRYKTLPFTWKADIFEGVPVVDINEVVCISGRLTSYKTKAEAKMELEKYGYRVKDTLTKDVTILVNESGIASNKTKSAESKGIRIVTNIKQLIGENNGST